MQQLAEDVWQLSGFPPNAVNVYVIGDVLIDAGMALDRGRILKQLDGRGISAHALTHAHPDHYGASHAICEPLGIPLWCGADDVEAVEAGKMVGTGGRMSPGRRRTRSPGACARATRSPASPCSTRPATPPATSPTGASPTARCSAAT